MAIPISAGVAISFIIVIIEIDPVVIVSVRIPVVIIQVRPAFTVPDLHTQVAIVFITVVIFSAVLYFVVFFHAYVGAICSFRGKINIIRRLTGFIS